jgi:hypothetical protein
MKVLRSTATDIAATSFRSNLETAMSDDKTRRAPLDAHRISLNEDYQVRYWTERLGVSKERLAEAVNAAGSNTVKAVEAHLKNR